MLTMTTTLLKIIDRIETPVEPPAVREDADDLLELPYERRLKTRQRVRLQSGREAGLFLPRGTVLRNGDRLVAENGLRLDVVAARERVSIATCRDPLLLTRIAYHLGNRHVAVEVKKDRLIYLKDHVLDDMVRGLGAAVTAADQAFEPEEGAYHGGGHHHSH
jgi:urease accessory protein